MVELFFITALLECGIKQYLQWDYDMFPNLLILGNTGSGKSYAIRLLLARISLKIPDSRLWVCDFKNELLTQPAPKYWGYTAVLDGFNDFFAVFEDRLNGNPDRTFCLLLIDEYISWLSSMEKAQSESIKKRMAQCLFMVRSLNMHIVLGAQRGMADNFSHGSRDCLNVLFLGSPSKESIRSFTTGEEAEAIKPCPRGSGFILFDGRPPKGITVPAVKCTEKVQKFILNGASR
jgi:hypothetical protein